MEEKKFDLIEEMTKSVEKKLSEIRSIVPVILTVVTALIAFFFTQKIPAGNTGYFTLIVLICVYLMLAFVSLILAFYPKIFYKQQYAINKNIDQSISTKVAEYTKRQKCFLPWDVSSYIKMEDEDFLPALKKYLNRELTDEEKIRANFLKQKVNELQCKRRLLNIAYGIILLGAVAFLIVGIVILWML